VEDAVNATQKAMNAVRNAWHYAEIRRLLRQAERKIERAQRAG
jgi:hypothetical protein